MASNSVGIYNPTLMNNDHGFPGFARDALRLPVHRARTSTAKLSLVLVLPVILMAWFSVVARPQEPAPTPAVEEPPPPTPSNPALDNALIAAEAQVRSRASLVAFNDISRLRRSLNADYTEKIDDLSGALITTIAPFKDLDQDGTPAYLLKWWPPEVQETGQTVALPSLLLLAWDGSAWHASRLLEASDPFDVASIHLAKQAGKSFAVITYAGAQESAYPIVFALIQHEAKPLWDSRTDSSRYIAINGAQVRFQDVAGDGSSQMVVIGDADPGVLEFPKGTNRGFKERAIYTWQGDAFVPGTNEFTVNPDFTLYRFLSALHLRDFKLAYGLADAAKLMKVDKPTPEAFEKFVQREWPEFLDDQIFSTRTTGSSPSNAHGFSWLDQGRFFVYHPAFSDDGKFLLTGLTKSEEPPPSEDSTPNP